jgi:hypothetical protein
VLVTLVSIHLRKSNRKSRTLRFDLEHQRDKEKENGYYGLNVNVFGWNIERIEMDELN